LSSETKESSDFEFSKQSLFNLSILTRANKRNSTLSLTSLTSLAHSSLAAYELFDLIFISMSSDNPSNSVFKNEMLFGSDPIDISITFSLLSLTFYTFSTLLSFI